MLRRIRDLNDEINKLIREKGHWEVRILELGGPDYARAAPKVQDSQGFEIQGATGKGAGYRWSPPPQVSCCKSALCAHSQLAALLPKSSQVRLHNANKPFLQVFWGCKAAPWCERAL